MAVIVRALVPAGWMPNTQGLGAAPLVICTGSGSEIIRRGPADGPAKPHSAERHDVCAFASLASAPPAPASLLAEPPNLPVASRIERAPEAARRVRLGYREQAARAPPQRV